jgi:hypothetical protein
MAGYSGKPLAEKLGIKPGHTVYVDGGPPDLDLAEGVVVRRLPHRLDVALLFCPDRHRLGKRLRTIVEHTSVNGMVWICWPKKASGIQSDLTENLVRETGLATGMVDVKVAAIDDTWSGLKFVRRVADR